ncbi:alkaline phosphatase [soil metagenome]
MSISYGFRRAGSAVAALAVGLALCGSAPAAEPAHAKNVILFIGDGMGVSTLTAARIYQGQLRGVDGASNRLSFETFPNLALVKTYSADSLVTDSANGASAMLTGVRTINGALGVDASVKRESCASALSARVDTLAELAKQRGLSTGAVSTAAITDATPAALYAHTGARSWQGDFAMPPEAAAAGCVDIARQLVDAPVAARLDLALGGGATFFTAAQRLDGRDLTREWAKRPDSAFVDTADALVRLPKGTRHLLGLFASNNMARETDRPGDAPRLADMTKAAITLLSQNPKGYFLMVEGGLIDKSHHVGLIHEALNETVEFDAAIVEALAMTSPADTLILVTADHSHGLTINGGNRNSPILGLVLDADGKPRLAADGKPFGILNYETGPGAPGAGETRSDPSTVDTLDPAYRAQAAIPLASAAHTGEDVAAYAQGPGAERLHGLIDQTEIFEVMRQALGIPEPMRKP